MNNNFIKLLYVDDQVEDYLSEYLEELEERLPELTTSDLEFEPKQDYSDLLNCPELIESQILIIDSRLFEEADLDEKERFTGEEFKLIIKKEYPYIEVLIISQNPDSFNLGFIPKYNSRIARLIDNDSTKHYDQVLLPKIKIAIDEINRDITVLEKLKNNQTLDPVVKNMIDNSMNGFEEYKTMNSEDVDNLINEFKKIQIIIEDTDYE